VFARFSPASRRILRLAEQECRNHNHYYVGAEHLLLALCQEGDPAIEAYLAERSIPRTALHAAVRRALGTGEDRTWDGIILTPRLRAIFELAGAAAGPSAEIEPVDLLEAISAERRSQAAEILASVAGNFPASSQVAG
jgi:ATP-dependent Clp protease ATP-binding subunit ClpA